MKSKPSNVHKYLFPANMPSKILVCLMVWKIWYLQLDFIPYYIHAIENFVQNTCF